MDLRADLVLEGGGVRGIALVGALEVLEERGYIFNRVAGTSAGAIVAALVAAEIPTKELAGIIRELNYRKFQDGPAICRYRVVQIAMFTIWKGAFRGDYLKTWLHQQLKTRGKETFGHLSYEDKGRAMDPAKAYKLTVTASDLSGGNLRFLPQDYNVFGRERDLQSVAEAVRASMSIPIFYRPVRWKDGEGRKAWLVDGGMLSNFPIGIFDTEPGVKPRWPTFGIKLSGNLEDLQGKVHDIRGPISMIAAMVKTWIGFYDQLHIASADAQARTIFIRTTDIASTTEFTLDKEQSRALYERGRRAAEEFLDGTSTRPAWNFERYIREHRSMPNESPPES